MGSRKLQRAKGSYQQLTSSKKELLGRIQVLLFPREITIWKVHRRSGTGPRRPSSIYAAHHARVSFYFRLL
jgi:hypothetical protein